jgi:hypothetical protein
MFGMGAIESNDFGNGNGSFWFGRLDVCVCVCMCVCACVCAPSIRWGRLTGWRRFFHGGQYLVYGMLPCAVSSACAYQGGISAAYSSMIWFFYAGHLYQGRSHGACIDGMGGTQSVRDGELWEANGKFETESSKGLFVCVYKHRHPSFLAYMQR